MIDLFELAKWVVALTTLATPGIFLLKFCLNISKRFKSLGDWNLRQQKDIEDGMVEHAVIVQGLLAALKGLQEQGCNGPVCQGIKDIEKYLNNQAHNAKSKL